jgi:serine phosphatase RsbU (regulator of sigma subunit)
VVKSLARRVCMKLYRATSRRRCGIRDRIESSLTKFSQGTSAADDITLVIVKRQT